MPDKYPTADGNWSNAANWNGGTKPASGDDVYADGKTITIDEDVNLGAGSIRTTQRSGGTTGGLFDVVATRSVTANVVVGSSTCLRNNGTGTLTLTGNVTGATSGTNVHGVNNASSGTINITGSVTGATSVDATNYAVRNGSSGNVTIAGTVTGGSAGTYNYGAANSSSGSLTINGNVTGGSSSSTNHGASTSSSGPLIITGNVSAGVKGYGVIIPATSAATVTVNGNVTGGNITGSAYGIYSSDDMANVVIVGDVTGGAESSTYAVYAAYGMNLTVTGNVTGGAGAAAYGVRINATGTVVINGNATGGTGSRAILLYDADCTINGDCLGSAQGNEGIAKYSATVPAYVRALRSTENGVLGATGNIRLQSMATGYVQIAGPDGTIYSFDNLLPAESDVRSGVTYTLTPRTGTCAVPAAASVAYGVPVDATTGTAVLTQDNVRTAIGLAVANLDSQLAAICNYVDCLPVAWTTPPTVAELTARTLPAAEYATAANLAVVAGYLDTEIAAIAGQVNTLYSDWQDDGRLDLLLDAAVSNAGTGARTVTITVNDGATALESASVRLTKGAETYIQTTNVSGQCAFNVDDGTWTVAITLHGYEFAGDSLVVDGDETATYSMTETAISAPASPSCTTGYCTCVGTDGLAESGVKIYAEMTAGPGTAGYSLDRGTITMTSNASGLAQHTGFVQGAYYKFKRGTDDWWGSPRLAPATTTWNLAEILGQP